MTILFNAWGPAGTLSSYDDFDRFQGNGVQDDTPFDSGDVGDRADIVSMDGGNAIRVKRYAGDPQGASGNRTELLSQDEAHIAEWVAAAEAGADADQAYRWYRAAFMVPDDFPTSYLSTAGQFVILHQLHVRPDSNDAATSPGLAVQIRVDSYGRLRYALMQNVSADAQQTSNDVVEVASWPFIPGQWQDICTTVHWSYTSAGTMTVYRNRRPILVQSGVGNTINNAPSRGGGGPYPKIGVYTSADLDMTVYHRGLIVGDKDATFADMYPELDNAVPLERVSGPVGAVI